MRPPLSRPQVFKCPPSFCVFAAQNPVREGGGRKGLPRSFLNRFTRVAVESMDVGDLQAVRALARLRPWAASVSLLWNFPAPAPKPLLSVWAARPNCGRHSTAVPLERA
jgi:hypothetical protein